jgi:hypothetical protein
MPEGTARRTGTEIIGLAVAIGKTRVATLGAALVPVPVKLLLTITGTPSG